MDSVSFGVWIYYVTWYPDFIHPYSIFCPAQTSNDGTILNLRGFRTMKAVDKVYFLAPQKKTRTIIVLCWVSLVAQAALPLNMPKQAAISKSYVVWVGYNPSQDNSYRDTSSQDTSSQGTAHPRTTHPRTPHTKGQLIPGQLIPKERKICFGLQHGVLANEWGCGRRDSDHVVDW